MENLEWIHDAFSTERLSVYRLQAGSDDLSEILRLYNYNLALSQSFYPLLQNIEIAIRNNINHALIDYYQEDIDTQSTLHDKINPGDPQLHHSWLELPGLLEYRERVKVQQNVDYIFKKHSPVTSGKIIANLNFGFWSRLFEAKYEQKIWHKIIKNVFPHAPALKRTRKEMAKRFNRFTDLRNRIFHHEPIFKKHNLIQIHDEILETLGWMQPELAEVTKKQDTFPQIYKEEAI